MLKKTHEELQMGYGMVVLLIIVAKVIRNQAACLGGYLPVGRSGPKPLLSVGEASASSFCVCKVCVASFLSVLVAEEVAQEECLGRQ